MGIHGNTSSKGPFCIAMLVNLRLSLDDAMLHLKHCNLQYPRAPFH